jgi:hypothetical protein
LRFQPSHKEHPSIHCDLCSPSDPLVLAHGLLGSLSWTIVKAMVRPPSAVRKS